MDTLSKAQRSERMSRIKGANTKPEMAVRRLLHGMGYRYRLHQSNLPGKPDIVFRPRQKVIFVHGCFWHRHPDPKCPLARLPKSRLEFWQSKLDGNRKRDLKNQAELTHMGWQCLIIWECQIKEFEDLKVRLREFLDK